MIRVMCIDAAGSTVLTEGQAYYAFPINGSKTAAYISRFNRESAHFGCFQMSRFRVLEDGIEQIRLF